MRDCGHDDPNACCEIGHVTGYDVYRCDLPVGGRGPRLGRYVSYGYAAGPQLEIIDVAR
jgi:hypothetical protein